LRTLYYETEPRVAGGHAQTGRTQRVAEAQDLLRAELADWPETEVDTFIARHYPDYWLKTDVKRQAEHARLLKRAHDEGRKLLADYQTDAFTAITELTVLAPNHPRLLSLIAGACAASGANIVGAHISTTRDGLALDTFQLAREFADDADETRRARRIGDTIEKTLKGEVWLDDLLAKRRAPEKRVRAFTVDPEIVIDNALSDQFTVIEVAGLDRPGLLYALTNALSDLSLDITSAHITTFGEKAVDAFYVTDLTSKKVTNEARQKLIRERLVPVLQEAEPEPAKA
jgi:[protein-PII] uridylyltransferase